MESARAWIDGAPNIPMEIAELIASHPDFRSLTEWEAKPEARVKFDQFGGEPANVDVLVNGRDSHGPLVIAVEAKADEPFSTILKDTLSSAQGRLEKTPKSKGVARIERLLQGLFGSSTLDITRYKDLRYQLMTLTAAALAEAERKSADRAIVIVHEFVTSKTQDINHAANAKDLDAFISAIAPGNTLSNSGKLDGPFSVPGKPIVASDIALYFGKVVVNRR